jgi:site-specific DNA-methyltransferase (adenine-specific)
MMKEVKQKKIKVVIHNDNYTIYNGNMLDMLEVIQPNSIDSIVCDPPYELNFMNRDWDRSGIAFNVEAWKKCYEVLKPGGYLLAFGGSRTFHRIAVAIEDAGFEIRDTIMWLYGSGFPKSMNIGLAIDKKNKVESKIVGTIKTHDFSKHKGSMMSFSNTEEQETKTNVVSIKQAQNEWASWGTALKPAYEPIIVARKPLSGTVVDNVLTYGVGGLNIEECRVEYLSDEDKKSSLVGFKEGQIQNTNINFLASPLKKAKTIEELSDGRFPANVIHDGSEEVISGFPNTTSRSIEGGQSVDWGFDDDAKYGYKVRMGGGYNDSGSAARYFYCAKASKKDRDEGLDLVGFEETRVTYGSIHTNPETARMYGARSALRRNIHPTVKPCELMQYLVRLVSPKGATILDPFMGSGSTGKAVMFENRERNANYKFIGIDLEEKYCQVANVRIDYALNKYKYDFIEKQQQEKQKGFAPLFDFLEG